AVLKQLVLNLFRLDRTGKKGGIKTRRLVASTSDTYRAALLGLG
ncbi:ISAs1 family transposase, partial [Azotobacter beijerinckii]|nr:ISAs1 family transposase [Azotobacter beijerinckii]